MNKGTYLATRIIEKSLDESIKLEIAELLKEATTYTYEKPDFSSDIMLFLPRISEEQLLTLKGYSGLNSKKINALLRDNWNYEEHGLKRKEDEQRINEDISIIDELIDLYPSTKKAFISYRGTTLDSFKKYGIEDIDSLIYLKGKYLYEEGYTSTSIDEKESYFNKEILGKVNNIEIKYIIPPNSKDGIPLTSDNLSYSPNQQEYLIERNSLSKVVDIKINGTTAVITALLIPKSIWNKNEKSNNKNEVKK